MDFSKVYCVLVKDEKQRAYFTGFNSTDGYLLMMEEGNIFVVDRRYYYAAKKQLKKKGIAVVCCNDYTVLEQLDETEKNLGVDFATTTMKEAETLRSMGFILHDVGDDIRKEMLVKSDREIALIKKACQIAQKAYKMTLPCLKAGVTEREVAAELEHNFLRLGASGKSFDTIVAFGANSAVPHHETGNKKLEKNMPVLMDFGCVYKGYCSDMTRTVWFGEQPPYEFVRAYFAVLGAHKSAYRHLKAGYLGRDGDFLARNILKGFGYGKNFTHSLGHGVGVNIHEAPSLGRSGDTELEDGMVFTIEPGVYLDGKFGIRIEDTVVMKNGKPSTFMSGSTKFLVTIAEDGTVTQTNTFNYVG